jgi:hypothetical protein
MVNLFPILLGNLRTCSAKKKVCKIIFFLEKRSFCQSNVNHSKVLFLFYFQKEQRLEQKQTESFIIVSFKCVCKGAVPPDQIGLEVVWL